MQRKSFGLFLCGVALVGVMGCNAGKQSFTASQKQEVSRENKAYHDCLADITNYDADLDTFVNNVQNCLAVNAGMTCDKGQTEICSGPDYAGVQTTYDVLTAVTNIQHAVQDAKSGGG